MQPVMKTLCITRMDLLYAEGMWVIIGKSLTLGREEPAVFVLEIRGVGAVVGVFPPISGLLCSCRRGWWWLATQGAVFASAMPHPDQGWLPGSPREHREPCWVNSWVGNHSAECLIIPLLDHPPHSPPGSGDGFGSDLPPLPLLTSVAKKALVFFSTGRCSLARTLLCKGLDGHKMGLAWLKPEQALVSGGRQEPGGALRWEETSGWGRAGSVMKSWVEAQSLGRTAWRGV